MSDELRFSRIKKITEPFGEIELEDGSIHTFRLAVGGVYRVFNSDGTPKKHEQGGSVYGFQAQQMYATIQEPVDKKGMN